MYFQPSPRYFCAEEFFSPQVFAQESPSQIWRLMDWRILYTIVEIRMWFKKAVHINSWKWGGELEQRGFRAFVEVLDNVAEWGNPRPSFSSFTSQHCFGRALDFSVEEMTAEEVRQDIIQNRKARRYQYISAIEDGVAWVHIDTRSWGPDLLIF